MVENTESINPASCCSEEEKESNMISHCPMAKIFEGTMGNPNIRMSLRTIGVIFIMLGIAIVFEPMIIAWLIALVTILMGASLLMMAHYLSRMNTSH